MIIKANGMIDAKAIAAANGFIDATPDVSLFTAKIFQKGGMEYKFLGWCGFKNGHYTAIELAKTIAPPTRIMLK